MKKNISKKEIGLYIKRLYRLLDNHPDKIVFKKLGKNQGYYVYGKGRDDWHIEIDYREQVIPTLIHECLHHWHPEWKHKQVYKTERAITNSLTKNNIKNILTKLGMGI